MIRHSGNLIVTALMLCSLPRTVRAQSAETSLVGPVRPNEIQQLVTMLGNASFEKRTFATRRLTAIGMPAATALREAAKGPSFETKLRAQALLRDFENRLFAGLDVHLAFSGNGVGWQDALDLVVTLTNATPYDTKVPFDIAADTGAKEPSNAQQVGAMLDISDYLEVRDPNGKELSMTVDDIVLDPKVYEAVNKRLDGGPTSVIPAGDTVTLRVRGFNRGWARYRFLDAGKYAVTLDYLPPWADPVLATNRIGHVRSNTAAVDIADSAPATVSRGTDRAQIEVHNQGDHLVAELVNQTDHPAIVNLNFGQSAPFAEGQWLVEGEGETLELPEPDRGGSWSDFDEDHLVTVTPGAQITLAEITRQRVLETLNKHKLDAASTMAIRFSYNNLCDRQWQRRQRNALLGNARVPPVLREPLPLHMLTIRQSSIPMAWKAPN